MMVAAPEAFVFVAFPREIPVKDYIQALPEMMLFFANTKCVPHVSTADRNFVHIVFQRYTVLLQGRAGW
jgi:hypothetical protein